MFEPFLQFFTLLICSFFRVSKDAWDLDHRIDFNNGKVIDSGNYRTRKTSGADLGFFKRESEILGSDRCDVIVMTSPIR